MYFYNHETGDMEWSTNAELALRHHMALMAKSNRYPLSEEAVGQLYRILGPCDPELTREEALRLISRALSTLGLEFIDVDAVVEALDDDWRLVLRLGDT